MNRAVLNQVAAEVRHDLETSAQIEAVGLFGSLERQDTWEHSDIDLFVITAETAERWEGVYLRRQGILVHLQVLSSLSLAKAMERTGGGPFFAALAGVQVWYDRSGQLTSAVQTAVRFDQSGRSARACKEFIEGVGSLHRAERCHRFGALADAAYELESALRSFASARLASAGTYPKRELWAASETASAPERSELPQIADLGQIIERTWGRARSQMEFYTRWIIDRVAACGMMTYHQLAMDTLMRGIPLCERLFAEMVEQGLLSEVEIPAPALGLRQVAYTTQRKATD